MRVGVVGAVGSTEITLKALIRHNFDIRIVMGLEPKSKHAVSGFVDLSKVCCKYNLSYIGFRNINQHVQDLASADLDVLFVVGLSQLVCKDIINLPRLGVIGFHPTDLPKGRGRAPIAWLIENQENGAACFFLINSEADSGPVFIKEPFKVLASDDASSVERNILNAMDVALDRWLPKLKKGAWNPIGQDHSQATEYGVRKIDDGLLNFNQSAFKIDRLIKAAAPPHPGAFTFFNNKKVVITKSRLDSSLKIQGCIGRILKIKDSQALVQTGDGLLWVSSDDFKNSIKVGDKLGYMPELEIYKILKKLKRIEKHMGIDKDV